MNKKSFVFGFLAALGLMCFAGSFFFLGSQKASPSSRSYEYAPVAAGAPPPPMEAMVPMPEMDERRDSPKRKEAKRAIAHAGVMNAFGSAGGAAFGDSIGSAQGFGGIGALGAGSAAKPASIVAKAKLKGGKDNDTGEAEGSEGGATAGAATRAWFPETFLFEPLVVTDAQGHATVPVKVPDRLTSWRVLALAHSREGGQAGAVASFLGTLPTYVDPVIPGFLVAGDEVRLPVQLVNTTAADVNTTLTLSALNATLSAAGGSVRVPAEGNSVQYVTLKVPRPGTAGFKATLGDTDAVERTIDVKPAGRMVTTSAGSTLAAPREVPIAGPADALEGSERVRLQVYPGALSLLRSELSAAPGRGGVAEDAYLLLLTGRAPALLSSLGAEPATDAIRDLGVLATQRAIRHARSPDVPSAVLLAEAALAHPDNPVLARLGERLAAQVAAAQRPDGTCQGANGWTLQRLLATTAGCVQSVRAAASTPHQKQRATAVGIKAQGAFERNLARINDGYTAAAILASGAVSGSVADALENLLLKSIAKGNDGAQLLPVDEGVVRADGNRPSVAEATALAVLALQGDAKQAAVVADLGTYLLANYSPVYGWGDGQANLVALRAVTQLFKTPVPAGVKISLTRDGKPVTEGVLDAAHLHDVLVLDALVPGSGGLHQWGVKAEPAVAGLGFSLTLIAHVPWKDQLTSGLEFTSMLPGKLEVGKPAELALTIATPANTQTKLKLALPAGVQADTPSLEALVTAGTISRFETEDGLITLHLNAVGAGATVQAKLSVVPTLAGTLHPAASTLEPEGRPQLVSAFKPVVWTVK